MIESLQIQNVRGLEKTSLVFGSGANVFWGDNGAGKTSVLEAVSVLSFGRSFVTANTKSMISFGSDTFTVFAKVLHQQVSHRLALQVSSSQERRIRVDGSNVTGQASISRIIPVLVFAPGGVDLVFDTPGDRRRFLDWGAFHCGGGSSTLFSTYRRVLAQRNSGLRGGILDDATLLSWDIQLATLGNSIDELRRAFVKSLTPLFAHYCDQLGLGFDLALEFYSGWHGVDLLKALEKSRERDRLYKTTTVGTHRADLLITQESNKARDILSRGQSKVVNLALLLAQVELAQKAKSTPVLCLDDPGSELDHERLGLLWAQLDAFGVQSLVTGVTPFRIGSEASQSPLTKMFHVKRGRISQVQNG